MDIDRISKFSKGFYVYYVFLIVGLVLILTFEKGDVLIWINHNSSSVADIFFKFWTYLGDGVVFAILLMYFLFSSYYNAVVTLLVILFQTIIVQGMKRFLFAGEVRPQLYFENFSDFHQVEGVNIHGLNSFPSGHTATAFAVAILLSLYFKNNKLTTIFLMAAILVGISRIYLLQHFFIDIYFGSIIGFLVSVGVYYFLDNSIVSKRIPRNHGLLNSRKK